MNTLNMISMTGTGGGWGMGGFLGMGFHGLAGLIFLLATGTVVWLLVRTARHALISRHK